MSGDRRRSHLAGRLGRVGLLALLALSGCVGHRIDPLEARLAEQRVKLRSLQLKVEELERAGVVPLQPAPSRLPNPGELAPVELPAVELAALRGRVTLLERALAAHEAKALVREPDPRAGKLLIPRPGQRAAPAPGSEVEILSVGAGDLVLGRIRGELERLTLAGVDAPLRGEDYAEDPERRVRQAAAFGAEVVKGDEAWQLSQEFLFRRVRGKRFSLRYARSQAVRAPNGSLSVVLMDGPSDLNAEIVAAGLALAEGPAYRAQEAQARLEQRGLFAPAK